MLLLDTNVVSELRKVDSGKADPRFAAWAITASSLPLFVSTVTLFELELGVLLSERSDPVKGAILRRWLDGVHHAFTNSVLPVDAAVARRAAALHVPNPAPLADSLIAATALVHRLTVVTRNTDDFAERSEALVVINPWEAADDG